MNAEELKHQLFVSAIFDLQCAFKKAQHFMGYIDPKDQQKRYGDLQTAFEKLTELLGFE